MKPLLVTFDVEEIDWLRAPAAAWDPTSPSAEGIEALLPILERVPIQATFFCTGLFAQRRSSLVRSLAEQGHEVASHGWNHRDDYARLRPNVACDRLRDSRRLLEDVVGREVAGVRTPRLSVCPAGVLADAGFTYDASPHPTWVRTGFRGFGMPRHPWEEEGLLRVPLSAVPVLRLPVAWYVFRVAGAGCTDMLARLAATGAPFLHLYFHPWEAAEPGVGMAWHPLGWRTGHGWTRRFGALMGRLAQRHASSTVSEVVRTWRARSGALPPAA